MKNYIILSLLMLFSVSVFSQILIDSKKVPATIQKTFKRKNSKASEMKWYEDRDNRQYTIKFKENGVDSEVLMSYEGVILEKSTDVDYKKLPQNIKDKLKKDYKNLKFASAKSVVKGRKDKYYSIIMHESQGRKKKPKIWEVQYTIQGKFLTVYEPPVEMEEEEISNDRYDDEMDEDAESLQGKVENQAVDKKNLPTAINKYLKDNYDYEYRAKEIYLNTNKKYGQHYYIVMKKQGEKKEYIHYFDTNGKLLKKEEVEL